MLVVGKFLIRIGTTKKLNLNFSLTTQLRTFFLKVTYSLPIHLYGDTVFLSNKNLFNEELIRAQEAEFHFRMLVANPKYKYIKYYLFYVRRGHSSKESQSMSIESKLSVFKYFDVAMRELSASPTKYKKVLEYIFYRQTSLIAQILVTYKNFKFLKTSLNFSLSYFKSIEIKKVDKIKILFGIITLFFFSKGYKLLKMN